MHVGGVSGQQHPAVSVRGRLTRHIGESGDRSGTVNPIIGPIDGDERFAEIVQGGLAPVSNAPFGHHDTNRPLILVDHLTIADLVLQPAEAMGADGIVADTKFWLVGHFDFRDQAADGRLPTREIDAGCLACQTAASVAADEVVRT
jgi:hypothetical protein